MAHTYLLAEGDWTAHGVLLDDRGDGVNVQGHARMAHGPDVWSLTGDLRVSGSQNAAFAETYNIDPMPVGADQTNWSADSPSLGHLTGSFILVDHSILSTGQSDCGRFVVSECIKQFEPDRYVKRGVLLDNGSRVASWAVELERIFG